MTWLLLIYSVPSQPTGKRAAVWRDLKARGAVYLRDGVAVLPERAETSVAFRAIADRIVGFDGEATVIAGARLESERAEALMARLRTERMEEYGELVEDAARLHTHIEAERAHRVLPPTELKVLREDLGKLRQWRERIRARDYFGADNVSNVDAVLDRCARMLAGIGAGTPTAFQGAPR